MSKNKVLKVKEAIEKAAKKLKKHPALVTKKEIPEISDWCFKQIGGLEAVKKAYFPVDDKDLAGIVETKKQSSYINSLEKKLGEKQLTEELLKEHFAKIKMPKIVKSKVKINSKKTGIEREVVVSLNDTHYGLNVDPEEVNDTNKYGWTEACRRTALLAKQVADYKIEKRSDVTKLHIVLNGDLIAGKIHDLTALTSDLLAIQQMGTIHILTHFINYVSSFYPKVVVHGLSGNHCDYPHRREGGRVLSHKYDSAMGPVFYALSAAFRNHKDIQFNFPKGLHIDINLPAGRLVSVHGDTLFSKQLGNPGSNINVKGLSDTVNRFNTGEINKGKSPAKMILFGHTHVHFDFTTFDGVRLYNAPSMCGIDSYAHSLTLNNNHCAQVIFESTKNHILGDPRLVELTEADNDKTLDEIIPIYNKELKWNSK